MEEVILFLGSNPEDAQFSQVNSQNTGHISCRYEKRCEYEKFMEQIERQKEKYNDAEIDVMSASIISFK